MCSARFISGIVASKNIRFSFNGRTISACEGESIASALMREGTVATGTSARFGNRKAYYCGMGVCWECVVTVDGRGAVRGCNFPVVEGMIVHEASTARGDLNE